MIKIDLDLIKDSADYFSRLSKIITATDKSKDIDMLPQTDSDYRTHVKNAALFLKQYFLLCKRDIYVRGNQINEPFFITDEEKEHIKISTEPISVSKLVFNINQIISDRPMKKLRSTYVTDWLMRLGYLQEDPSELTYHKICTPKSEEIGITPSIRINTHDQSYHVNLYDQNAQKFVIENTNSISTSTDTV